jgi:hypothetical protein
MVKYLTTKRLINMATCFGSFAWLKEDTFSEVPPSEVYSTLICESLDSTFEGSESLITIKFSNLVGQYRSINGGELEQVSPTTDTLTSVEGTLNILYTEEALQEWENETDEAVKEMLDKILMNFARLYRTNKLNEENND